MSAANGVTGGGADPFTGASTRRLTPSHIPAKVFYIFDIAPKLDAVGGKIREFSSGLSAVPDTADLSLTEAEVAPGGSLDALLAKYAPSSPHFVNPNISLADAINWVHHIMHQCSLKGFILSSVTELAQTPQEP